MRFLIQEKLSRTTAFGGRTFDEPITDAMRPILVVKAATVLHEDLRAVRRGLTKKSLMPGTKIVVDGYQSKDGSLKGNGRDLTFPDGRKLFLGSSGTGAPKDGADPREPKKKEPNNY